MLVAGRHRGGDGSRDRSAAHHRQLAWDSEPLPGARWHQGTRRVFCPGFLVPLLLKAWADSPAWHPAKAPWGRGGEAQQGLGACTCKSRGCEAEDGTGLWSQPVCRFKGWVVPKARNSRARLVCRGRQKRWGCHCRDKINLNGGRESKAGGR